MKKIIFVFLFFVFSTPVNAYSDLYEEHPHYYSIKFLSEEGILAGYDDGSFKPENTINRAEFLKIFM